MDWHPSSVYSHLNEVFIGEAPGVPDHDIVVTEDESMNDGISLVLLVSHSQPFHKEIHFLDVTTESVLKNQRYQN